MKLNLAAAILLSVSSSQAFTTPRWKSSLRRPISLASSTEGNDEYAKLREQAAKAREEAERLSQELGKSTTAPVKEVKPKKTKEELNSLLPTIINEADVGKQAEQWNDLKESKSLTNFGQANLRTFPVSLQMLEQRTSLTAESLGLDDTSVSLDDFKYATLGVTLGSGLLGVLSLALLPPNIGATLCYFFAIIPILFLGIGSSAPQIIANAIASIKGTDTGSSVSEQERICRHEAAHFCCGYWCGLPVKGYSVSDGVARVEFGVSNSQFSNTEVAALSVTALGGLVGEALKWEKAQGAQNDLLQLENVFRASSDFIGSQAQQDITRWGALTATNLLKTNADQYEKVVEAFSRQAPIEECISILES